MNIQESGEMYLEAILILQKNNKNIRSVDIVNYTGYSKPSISRAMSILRQNGFIEMANDGEITLTSEGSDIANKIYGRHVILTEFLERLGISSEMAVKDACKIEHCISDETFNKIKIFTESKN